jgi:carboxymethylenebutenolidase
MMGRRKEAIMSSPSRVESVQTPDGSFDLSVWLPDAGTGPGLLLIQEIFGVSDYIRAVADDLAGLGYVVGAPDLFWRLEPRYQAKHDEEGLKRSLEMGSRFDFPQGVTDAAAALGHLAALPEVEDGLGVIGFCFGGTIAYFLAAQADMDVMVSFYGSGVPDNTDLLDRIDMPAQFVFGGSDAYIPRDQVAKVEAAVAGKPNVEMHVEEDAGHAFHNRKSAMFHMPEPAARAWQHTEEFLRRHLPARHHQATPAS